MLGLKLLKLIERFTVIETTLVLIGLSIGCGVISFLGIALITLAIGAV